MHELIEVINSAPWWVGALVIVVIYFMLLGILKMLRAGGWR